MVFGVVPKLLPIFRHLFEHDGHLFRTEGSAPFDLLREGRQNFAVAPTETHRIQFMGLLSGLFRKGLLGIDYQHILDGPVRGSGQIGLEIQFDKALINFHAGKITETRSAVNGFLKIIVP